MMRKYQSHVHQGKYGQNGKSIVRMLAEQILAGLAWYA